MSIPILGIETEYGIIREDQDTTDPVEESMLLLKRCERESVFGRWAYRRENSHLDLRGFQVSHLAQDEEEDTFAAEDRARPYSYLEMKSDRVLVNGARFYNDHTHPEYTTPECNSVFELVAHDLAGERIVAECTRLRNRDLGTSALQVFKNNTDYSGHSYGTHENYLIPRARPFEHWVGGLVPFLVTRQLFAGAGKVGSETGESFSGLQLAQRSDFIEAVMNIETMTKRPIVNTRDEPHTSPDKHRRLHLILGDANMSPYATALKVGVTRLVLTLLDEDRLGPPLELEDPVADTRRVSRERSRSLRLKAGGTILPLEIQEHYLALVKRHYEGQCKEWDWSIHEWERTLREFRHAPEKLGDRIDWAIKERLFAEFMAEENIGWDDPWMKSLDLEYHNLDPARSLYRGLEEAGSVLGLVSSEEIAHAMANPPEKTRAAIRGRAVAKEKDRISKIHWTGIEFDNGDRLDLTDVVTPADVEHTLNSNKEKFPWI